MSKSNGSSAKKKKGAKEINTEVKDDLYEMKQKLEKSKKKSVINEEKIHQLNVLNQEMTTKLTNSHQELKKYEDKIVELSLKIAKKKEILNKNSKKVEKSVIYKIIDDKCDETLEKFLEPFQPTSYDVEVLYNDRPTVFTLSVKQAPNFGQFKELVAPYYSVTVNDIFFTDIFGNIFPDELKIRDELFPLYKQKFRNKIPRIKMILGNNMNYEQLIKTKLMDITDNIMKKPENKEDNSGLEEYKKRKELEELKMRKAALFKKTREMIAKFQGGFITLIFLCVIIMWIIYFFANLPAKNINTIRSVALNLYDQILNSDNEIVNDPVILYSLFNEFVPTDQDLEEYKAGTPAFFLKNNVLNQGQIIQKLYNVKTCDYLKPEWAVFYQNIGLGCYEESENTTAMGTDSNLQYIVDDPAINFQTNYSNFQSSGFHYQLNFNNWTKVQSDIAILNIQNTTAVPPVYGWVQYQRAMYFVTQVNFFNPSYTTLTCSFDIIEKYNYDIAFQSSNIYTISLLPLSPNIKNLNIAILCFAALLMLITLLDTVKIIFRSSRELDEELVLKRKCEREGAPYPSNKKRFWSFDVYFLVIKVYLPSMLELKNIMTLILLVVSSANYIEYEQEISSLPFDANNYFNCRKVIHILEKSRYISAVLIHLLVMSLLQYMSEWVPSFYLFSEMISNFLKNVLSLGIMIIWILLSLTLYGLYTFGPHLNHTSKFYYMFANLIFITLRKQQFLVSTEDYTEYNNMKRIVGNFTIIWFVLFTYIIVTFILFNIITAIVTKSINQTIEEAKERAKEKKSLLQNLGAGRFLSTIGL